MDSNEAIMDSLRSMVARGIIPDMDFAMDVLDRYDGPVTRRRVVSVIVMAAGVAPEFPAWRASAPGTAPTIGNIIDAVCAWRGADAALVSDRGGGAEIARTRGFAAWCARRGFGYPLTLIGERMGGRSHTTMLQAINKADMIVERHPAIRSALLSLCDRIDDECLEIAYGGGQAAEA